MLTPRMTHCTDCMDALSLINEIDCKLAELSNCAYNKIIYGFKGMCNTDNLARLLHYRRILVFKYFNPDYADPISEMSITSKVKLLLNK